MNQSDESAYYKFLEGMILKSGGLSSDGSDVFRALALIRKENPDIMDRLLSRYYDTSSWRDAMGRAVPLTQDRILKLLATSEKGTVIKWKDGEGRDVFFINTGKELLSNKKRISIVKSTYRCSDINMLRKSLAGEMIVRDLEKIRRKMQRDERARMQRQKDFMKALSPGWKDNLGAGASSFERNFKELCKAGFAGGVATAAAVCSSLDGSEKEKVRNLLSNVYHVKNTADLSGLLDKWRAEALKPVREKQIKLRSR